MNGTEAEQFFYDHAGWGYIPGSETPEQGRERGAIELAASEAKAIEQGYTWRIDEDPDAMWDDDVEREHTDYSQWFIRIYDPEGEFLGSLGSVDIGPDADPYNDPYIRVVKAELADEHMAEYEAAKAEERNRQPAYVIDREYAEELAGQELTDDQIERFTEAIGNSSVPEALREVLAGIIERDMRTADMLHSMERENEFWKQPGNSEDWAASLSPGYDGRNEADKAEEEG